jgi:hypothetical protein
LALPSVSALAHPVYDLYDLTTELEMTGTVLRFEFATPHSWLYISVIDEAGAENRWAFEMDPSPLLRRHGVDQAFWKTGDRISVRANPMKDGRMAGLLLGAIAASGNAFGETEGLATPEAG